ncbi:Retrovirus-related Pol polyprotein from transposon TNT 1-94 [Gossypium australe]|uniref:Retrovirus-related Pol polyprotein from transposon TNT 1-94 n=1 Tax=Gossypium australe TaxID=47621 RepID=A0A5B6U7K4_9ROSI|nr:Retrovirus-related Pol polyprotein from transposon TNT 1-94 [Gossypium australe]
MDSSRLHGLGTLNFANSSFHLDNIIITGTNTNVVQRYIELLAQHFSIKDLGALFYFFCIEVLTTPSGLLLTQKHCIANLFTQTKMSGAHLGATPLTTDGNLTLHSSTTLTDFKEYRTSAGSLQYFCLTCPDITYVVNKLSQFMHHPTFEH